MEEVTADVVEMEPEGGTELLPPHDQSGMSEGLLFMHEQSGFLK